MTIGVACTDDGGVDTVLTIAGGANAAGSTTTIAGNLTVSGTTELSGDTTLTTNKKLLLRDAGNYIHSSSDGQLDIINSDGTGNTAVQMSSTAGGITLTSNNLFCKTDTVTVGSAGTVTATSSPGTVHYPVASVVLLSAASSSTNTTYHWDMTGFGDNGQMLHIFYDDTNDTGVDVQINFGSNNLGVGTGLSSSIKFTGNGQSVSLIYLGANGSGKWRVINTGGIVA
mgnify:FL=1